MWLAVGFALPITIGIRAGDTSWTRLSLEADRDHWNRGNSTLFSV